MLKKILKTVAIIIIIFFGVVVLDRLLFPEKIIIPREAHIVNVPEIQPFLAGRKNFRGIEWNLESNYIIFAFVTTFKTPESYFNEIHDIATSEGWMLTNSSINKRTYKKIIKNTIPSTIKFFSELKVVLSYETNKFEVILELEEISRAQ